MLVLTVGTRIMASLCSNRFFSSCSHHGFDSAFGFLAALSLRATFFQLVDMHHRHDWKRFVVSSSYLPLLHKELEVVETPSGGVAAAAGPGTKEASGFLVI